MRNSTNKHKKVNKFFANGYQTKIPTFIPKDDLIKPVHSSEFLEELKLQGLFDVVLIPAKTHRKFPFHANLSFLVYKFLKGFKTDSKALSYVAKQHGLFEKMGYTKDCPPNWMTISNFRTKILTKEGEKQLLHLIEQFRHDNNYIITDSFLPHQPIRNEQKISLTVREKRAIVRACVKYIKEFRDVNLKKNCTIDNKTVFEAIIYFLSEASTANGFSDTYRNDPIQYKKVRQSAPTGRTILNRLRKIFRDREDVEKFFDHMFNKTMSLIKEKMPDAFNRRYIKLAFDYLMVPSFEDTEKIVQKRLFPDKFRRKIYTNPTHLIGDSHIKQKGTINFRKFLCCSIVVKGFRFCVCYLPVTMETNSRQSALVNKMIDKIKHHINFNFVSCVYFDRGFDNLRMQLLLRKRGINHVMGKVRHKGELMEKINAVTDDLALFEHTMSKKVKLNIIVIKKTPKNEGLFNDDDSLVDDKGQRKFVFCTNMKVTKENARELVEGYRSRWSIETMFKDKNKFYGKTTSNDSKIRDFYFAYTMILFNVWVLCNLVIFFIFLKKEPDEPKIRIITFRNYLKGTEFKPPDESESFFQF